MLFIKILLLIMLGVASLFNADTQHRGSNEILARVHNQYLYLSELSSILTPQLSKEEKKKRIQQYVDHWVKKQLMIVAAKTHPTYDELEVQRKLLNYRYDLIIQGFMSNQVMKRLDTKIKEEEITKYFTENQANFILNHTLVKGRFVQVPRNIKKSTALGRLIVSEDEADQDHLKSYCEQFADRFNLDKEVWIRLEDITRDTPFEKIRNQRYWIERIRRHMPYRSIHQNQCYYYYIEDYHLAGDLAPLEYVREDIETILLHKRKVALAKKIKKEIIAQAERNKAYEIYQNKP